MFITANVVWREHTLLWPLPPIPQVNQVVFTWAHFIEVDLIDAVVTAW